jgi:hypothetical protein
LIGGLRQGDKRHLLPGCKLRGNRTQDEKRPDSNDRCATLLEIRECASHRRTSIGHIVANRHASAAKPMAKRFGNPVTGRKQAVLSETGKSLGIHEICLELQSHHQPNKSPFDEWGADHIGSQLSNRGRQFVSSRLHQLRFQAKSLEIEPQISMGTRLQQKMPRLVENSSSS